MLILVAFFIASLKFIQSSEGPTETAKYAVLEVALKEGTFSAHGYPDQMIKLSKVKDGTNVFIMHKGPSIEKEDAVAFESLKFRDHYIHIDSNNNVKLKKLEDPEAAKDSILFWNNNEVELNRHIYRLLTKEYSFLCHQISYPYHVYVGLDDDTKVFAQTCSYIQRPATDNEVQSLLGGKTENNVVEIQLARRDGKISGMIVDDNGKVRIGEKGDEFIMHKPGLIGNLNTVSFALKSDKNLFLHSTKKDINFKQSDNSKEFQSAASFIIERPASHATSVAIHPYANQEYSLAMAEVAPYYLRLIPSKSDTKFEKYGMWKIKSNGFSIVPDFNIFSHEELVDQDTDSTLDPIIHEEILKMVANPASKKFDADITDDILGKIDLKLLRNPSSIWNMLVNMHTDNTIKANNWIMPIKDDIYFSHEYPTFTKVTEVNEWSTCSTTCGNGKQYRVIPCPMPSTECTPIQEWKDCNAGICDNIFAISNTDNSSPSHERVCPKVCSSKCDPLVCDTSCCSVNFNRREDVNKPLLLKRKLKQGKTLHHKGPVRYFL